MLIIKRDRLRLFLGKSNKAVQRRTANADFIKKGKTMLIIIKRDRLRLFSGKSNEAVQVVLRVQISPKRGAIYPF